MAVLPIDFGNQSLQALLSQLPSLNTLPTSAPTATSTSSGGIPILNSVFNNQTATGLPRTAEQAGALALLGYSMRPQKDITVPSIYDSRSPYGTSSVNYLQGLYQSPSDPFAAGGIYEKYLPLLQQQQRSILNDAQQRIIAGLPGSASTSIGGSEIGSIGEALQSRIAPSYQALFADLTREQQARQQNAANTVYGGENNLNQIGFAANIEAAISNAKSESERNAILGALGTSLLLSGRGGAGTSGPGTGSPGTGTAAGTQQGGIGQALQQYLGGAGNQGAYAPIGQMSVQDIIGQMQAGTLSGAEGLALIARTQGLPLIGTAAAGYGAGQLASQLGQNQFQSSAGGALAGAATGALLGSTILPGVGTAIGAIVGGLAGLIGGFTGERTDQAQIKEAFRQSDLDSQADQVQEIGSFFTQRLGGLGIDTTGFQSFVSQQIAASPSGAGAYSFGGISGTADQQQAVGAVGGQLLLKAIQQTNPSITSLTQVPGLRTEFIDYLTRSTFSSGNSSASGGPPVDQFAPWATSAGLAQGGTLPAGGEFIVGERGPELLRASPGSQVLPMLRGQGGGYSFDPTATARNVVPSNIYLPQTSLPFEGPGYGMNFPHILPFGQPTQLGNALSPGQALIGALGQQPLAPGSVPAMIASLRLQGMFPGQGSPVPGTGRPPVLPPVTRQNTPLQVGRPSFAGSRPTGSRGQSTLATALQQHRTRRKLNASTHA